jgi:hypothetical protein
MTSAGLLNGANYNGNPDALHFFTPDAPANQNRKMVNACSASYAALGPQ